MDRQNRKNGLCVFKVFVLSCFGLVSFSIHSNAGTIFNNNVCHPKVQKACVLHPYLNFFKRGGTLSYSNVVAYYRQVGNGLIQENPQPIALLNSEYKLLSDQRRSSLEFTFNLKHMIFEPVQDLSAETVQSLFNFNFEEFKRRMSTSDFQQAKLKYYRLQNFDRKSMNFDREIILFTDWRSLIHPPVTQRSIASVGSTSGDDSILSAESKQHFLNREYQDTMDVLTRTELTSHNQLKLLINNVAYQEKIKLILSAKSYVFLAVMSFQDSAESDKIVNALIKQAKRGIDVRVIMEKVWGKIAFKDTIKKLRNGGVRVGLANDLIRMDRNQGLFHSKYLVVDGVTAISGGQNLVDRSHYATGYNHYNKDTDVFIQGPMVTDMTEDYILLWERFTKSTMPLKYKYWTMNQKENERVAGKRGSENYQSWFNRADQGLCRFISQGPNEDKYKLSKAYLETFQRAQSKVVLTTQIVNFKDDPTNYSTRIYQTLMKQARSGKSVQLVTNGIDGGFLKNSKPNESDFRQLFSRTLDQVTGYLNTVLRRGKQDILASVPGFDVWQHFQYIHSKVALVDDTVAAIGSYNFETFSSDHSYETAVFCQDDQLVKDLKQDLMVTIANSVPVIATKK
jgi:phosphatidylserine/phosphatidylglycerophosphate/cardiolipin synthase-like enzyme